MWKLTVIQKRKSESSDFIYEETVELISKDLDELTAIIERLAGMCGVKETSYKIEKMKEGGSNEI